MLLRLFVIALPEIQIPGKLEPKNTATVPQQTLDRNTSFFTALEKLEGELRRGKMGHMQCCAMNFISGFYRVAEVFPTPFLTTAV